MAGAYAFLSERYEKTYGVGVAGIARQLGYPESTVAVVDESVAYPYPFAKFYPDTYACIKSCQHQRDVRSEREYAKDIVASWTMESLILERLRSAGVVVELSGSDADRMLLKSTSVQASADMTAKIYGKKIKVELVCDFTGYWTKTGKMHLRDCKLSQLAEEKALILAIDGMHKTFYLFDAATVAHSGAVTYLDQHPVWGKPAAEINLEADKELIIVGKDTGSSMAQAMRTIAKVKYNNNNHASIDKVTNSAYTGNSDKEACCTCVFAIPYIPKEYQKKKAVTATFS